jgi:chemotaxis protein CheC
MSTEPLYTDMQLSAIQEIANIGTGNAATSLSQMIGASVDIDPPQAELVSLELATDRLGAAETPVVAVLTPVVGVAPASILLAVPFDAAASLCGMLGVDALSDMGRSALQEIGNILTASYLTAIGSFTNLDLEPAVPMLAVDMLGAVVDGVLAMAVADADQVLFLTTSIRIEDAYCDFAFLYVPAEGSVATLLGALGLL